MHSIFLDHTAFIALEDATHPKHARAKQLLTKIAREKWTPVTTNLVFAATYDRLVAKVGVEAAFHFTRAYRLSGILQRIPVDDDLELKAWEVARKNAGKSLTFTQASSIAAIQHLGLKYAFSFDPKLKLSKAKVLA